MDKPAACRRVCFSGARAKFTARVRISSYRRSSTNELSGASSPASWAAPSLLYSPLPTSATKLPYTSVQSVAPHPVPHRRRTEEKGVGEGGNPAQHTAGRRRGGGSAEREEHGAGREEGDFMPAMHSRASHSDIAKLLGASAFCASRAGRLGGHNARVFSHSVLEPGALVQKNPSKQQRASVAPPFFNALTVPPQAGSRICAKSLLGIDPANCRVASSDWLALAHGSLALRVSANLTKRPFAFHCGIGSSDPKPPFKTTEANG